MEQGKGPGPVSMLCVGSHNVGKQERWDLPSNSKCIDQCIHNP